MELAQDVYDTVKTMHDEDVGANLLKVPMATREFFNWLVDEGYTDY